MRRLFLVAAWLLALTAAAWAGAPARPSLTDDTLAQKILWAKVKDQINNQHYAAAYRMADSVRAEAMKRLSSPTDTSASRLLLTAHWYMADAALRYQENAYDSAMVRYRRLLPLLGRADRAICHLVMFEADSALADTAFLATVPIAEMLPFAEKPKNCSFNLTPTMYDLVMTMAANRAATPRAVELLRAMLHRYEAMPPSAYRTDLVIYTEIRIIQLLNHWPNTSHSRQIARWQECLDRHRSERNELLAEAHYSMALLYKADSDFVAAVAHCDSAIDLYAQSEYGISCQNLRNEICRVEVETTAKPVAAGRRQLVRVKCRNTDHLHYRVIKNAHFEYQQARKDALKKTAVAEWDQPLDVPDDHRVRQFYGYVPELPAGEYILLVSPSEDFAASGFDMESFVVAPATFILSNSRQGIHGYLVDYATGQPIAGQKVTLEKEVRHRGTYNWHWVAYATAETDGEGFFRVGIDKDWEGTETTRVRTRYEGFDIVQHIGRSCRIVPPDTNRGTKMMTDRPIYRPGDTVQFVLLAYETYRNSEGGMAAERNVRFWLTDPNGKRRDSIDAVTDADGAATGRFAIAPDALPGSYTLWTSVNEPDSKNNVKSHTYTHGFRVEAYKQPKFTVTLNSLARHAADGSTIVPALGDSLAVEGLAASYSQVPIGGAQVVYSVSRQRTAPWWRIFNGDKSRWRAEQIASDTLVTDAEGHFRIAFAALPDSSAELSEKPIFSYTVRVDVTDLNGETHSQTKTLRLGYSNSYLAIEAPAETDSFASIGWRYCDLNDTPLQGDVKLSVERLRLPDKPYLAHLNQLAGCRHTMGEEEFGKRYPLTPYDVRDADISRWPAEKTVHSATLRADGLTAYTAQLPKLEAGAYRIRMSCGDAESEATVVYMPRNAKHATTSALLWADIDKGTALPGEKVTLRVGSRHKELFAICQVMHNDSLASLQTLRLDDNIKTIELPVTEEMLGGMEIQLFAVKEGRDCQISLRVEVPFTHKELEVEFVTFRDKLTPGEQETWTLKAKPAAGSKFKPARMLLGMYDAALDSYYGPQEYSLRPWMSLYSAAPQHCHGFRYESSTWNKIANNNKYRFFQGKRPQGWSILNGGLYEEEDLYEEEEIFYDELPYIEIGTPESGQRITSDDIAHMPGTAVESIVASVGGVGYSDGGTARGENGMVKQQMSQPAAKSKISNKAGFLAEDSEEEVSAAKADEVYMRKGLSTLAFFNPNCRTDADGTVSFTFTAPDLLTQWNAQAFAWTRDLSTGSAKRQLVTQKQLMIQPNMPRFLREGDTASLMAKVSNLTDSAMRVTVDFNFEISGAAPIEAARTILLPANGTVGVSFPVRAVCGGTVATYRFTARGSRHSDGEQGALPLLTNRQAVTASVSMYANGSEAKHYSLELPTSETAQPVGLTVEYTANPIWLAIQSLPYMADHKNPSNIYLFNSWYANTLGLEIAKKHPELRHAADNAADGESPLFANADIKQTLLDETPWLRDGLKETDRLRRIANYYNEASLQQQLDETLKTLKKEQRLNGSWPWMPDGKYPSLHTTQYILRGLGQMSRRTGEGIGNMEIKALGYIDGEAYKAYLEWKRLMNKYPGIQCEPINLDYLYTRSFYGGKRLGKLHKTAYDFYYSNLKKNHSDYTTLYNQALLALIFHRHGDTKLATEMVARIKEKALYSDEMGMYWRDNRSGWFWYQRPIETQALLIETFREVTPGDTASVARMQQWLLKQKQTTSWNTDIATLRAIQALTDGASATDSKVIGRVVVAGGNVNDTLTADTIGAAHLRHTYRADSLQALASGKKVDVTIRAERANTPKRSSGTDISWGAIYYQYTEFMDRVPASETGIAMHYEVLRINPDGSATPADKAGLCVGDRCRIRLNIECDRNLEYVELKSHRAACLEPISTRSGWRWSNGLSYYIAVNNSHDALYIDRLDKGKYIIEADYYVTNPGDFTLAPAVIQCLYAPEFRSTSAGRRLRIAEQ